MTDGTTMKFAWHVGVKVLPPITPYLEEPAVTRRHWLRWDWSIRLAYRNGYVSTTARGRALTRRGALKKANTMGAALLFHALRG